MFIYFLTVPPYWLVLGSPVKVFWGRLSCLGPIYYKITIKEKNAAKRKVLCVLLNISI